MKVRDFMIKDVVSVHKDTTVKELLSILVEHRIGGAPVVDDENRLIGMVSDGDVLRYLAPKAQSFHDAWAMIYVVDGEAIEDVLKAKINTTVGQMMHQRNLIVASPDDEFENAIRLLSKHHFKKLPVVDTKKHVVGVISRGDVVYNLSKKIIS